jgi:maltose alpha-D-glucosyltransferase/alpha-amylase
MVKWFEDAVFYEIYPQSFYDANGDGIGDFAGIIEKLDYIRELGCTALWLNPCFDSPFKDAGYDVREYTKTAERYGGNEDLERLFNEAHKKCLRVILDLVPGHTSEEHPWFAASSAREPKELVNRYVWTDHCFERGGGIYETRDGKKVPLIFIGGEAERDGTYLINFFKCQPALNYGFLKPERHWQLPVNHPDCVATKEALKDIMRFWLDKGCDGFRVDIAGSLVKCDDDVKSGTCAIWREIRAMLDADYPDTFLAAEWSQPELSLKAGFNADFLLSHQNTGYRSLMRAYDKSIGKAVLDQGERDRSFFKKDGNGDIMRFLDDYLPKYECIKQDGFISLITGNHDTIRARFNLSPRELKLAYAMIFTFPGIPFLYYGDEIGMRHLDIPTKEGGYFRTGARTPMQWKAGKNLGFSSADASKLYLPVDNAPDAPVVESEARDSESLLNTVKNIIRLRRDNPELNAQSNLEILFAEKERLPFMYKRGHFIMAVNPSAAEACIPLKAAGAPVFSIGAGTLANGECVMAPQSFCVWNNRIEGVTQ